MKTNTFAITVALFLTTAAFAQSLPKETVDTDPFRDGQMFREKRAFEQAEKSYQRALEHALHLKNPELEFQAYFYLGLTRQEMADDAAAAGDKDRAKRLRREAEETYEKAYEMKPRSTATLLNLAEVAVDNESPEDAEKWLERGLSVDDKRAAQFAEKLGDLKAEAKEPKEALKSYRLALKKKNASTSVSHKYFTQLLLAAKEPDDKYSSEATAQLWELLKDGEVDPALDGAFAALESGAAFGGERAVEMMAIVACALSEKEYDAVAFRASSAAASLRKLSANPALAPRITALFALYEGVATPDQVAVWRTDGDYARPPERPSGIESLQHITRGVGYAAQRTRDFARAESAYNLALRLDPQRLDPGTLRDLATIYYAQGKLDALGQLLRDFEERLYAAKAAAYEHVDWEEVYEYHLSIGMLYLWVGRPADAKAQFDRAKDAAERLQMPIDPDLLLARSQANFALGDRAAATRERLEAAEQYIAAGDLIRARRAVARIARQDAASEEDAKRYRAILDRTINIDESLENVYDVKSALAILSTDPEKPMRIETEKVLAGWGVTNVRFEDERGTFAYAKRTVTFALPAEPLP
jgi:tetratricopeptide (TPR) repeat protein